MLEPLLTAQVLAADLILVNKIDIAPYDRVEAVVCDIQGLKPSGKILTLAASREEDVVKVAEVIHNG